MKELKLTTCLYITIFIAILLFFYSLLNLLFRHTIYNSPELYNAFVVNDIVNLLFVIPSIAIIVWLVKKNQLVGFLCWLGILLFVIYNSIAYLVALPLLYSVILHSIIILAAIYSFIKISRTITIDTVYLKVKPAVKASLFGSITLILGILFVLRAVIELQGHIAGRVLLPINVVGVNLADIIISSVWIICSGLLLFKKKFGYVSIVGIYFQACLLFAGLIMLLMVRPIVTNTSFPIIDILVIVVMSLPCLIPFIFMIKKLNYEKTNWSGRFR